MTGVPIKERKWPCKDKAEIGGVLSEAKKHLGLLEAGRDNEGSSSRGFGGNVALPTP